MALSADATLLDDRFLGGTILCRRTGIVNY
jgi:hypothetical protein